MRLVNLSDQTWLPLRRKRNEAIYHHLLSDTELFSGGTFVSAPQRSGPYRRSDGSPLALRCVHMSCGTRPSIVIEAGIADAAADPPGLRQYEEAARAALDLVHAQLSGEPYVLLMNSLAPYAQALWAALARGAAFTIYDLSDDFLSWDWSDYAPDAAALHREVIATTGGVLYVNEVVAARHPHPNGLVFLNGADLDRFVNATADISVPPWFPKPAGERYVGYLGTLDPARMDADLIDHCASALPTTRFLFIGYCWATALLERLTRHSNVTFVGSVDPAVIPGLTRQLDVGIVPHVVNDYTAGNDLLKIRDYLAAGIPVVTTPCSGVARYAPAVQLATGAADFATTLRRVLDATADHDPSLGRELLRAESWTKRVPTLVPWIRRGIEHRNQL